MKLLTGKWRAVQLLGEEPLSGQHESWRSWEFDGYAQSLLCCRRRHRNRIRPCRRMDIGKNLTPQSEPRNLVSRTRRYARARFPKAPSRFPIVIVADHNSR